MEESAGPTAAPEFGRHSIEEYLAQAGTGRRQSLAGFDADYTDFVDYIVRCTHKIWEEKAVGLIYTHYSHNATVHTANGTVYGREAVVRGTLQHLAMASDIRNSPDDVIWTGDDRQGFYTSHRVWDSSTHRGYGEYGPPTGRRVFLIGISHHVLRNGRVVQEWTLFDEFALYKQLHAQLRDSVG